MTKRLRILFSGTVQGVGFRPFIYTCAHSHCLNGFVQNRCDGVVAEVEGSGQSIDDFIAHVREHLPPLAELTGIRIQEIIPGGQPSFRILPSRADTATAVHISPDIATCSACLEELFNPQDRRYRYPFINCTNCGPRLTIIRNIPYDRCNTSMAGFELCKDCRKEYEDVHDRRFHAQPNACSTCGPRLCLCDAAGHDLKNPDPLEKAIGLIRQGFILAIKGLGGFHLCVDAASDVAVKRLRDRKLREAKPLAVMTADIETARQIARINHDEEALLCSPSRPIVLLEKRTDRFLSPWIAPGLGHIGIMLPYTPLHHLILAAGFKALVMTSGNRSDDPICIENEEAFTRLRDIAEYFLVHNRDIIVRCDDSIAFVEQGSARITRRSRGYVPRPVTLAQDYPAVLAVGAHMKSAVCIIKGNHAFLSPHIGDMETPQARDFFHESISLMKHITECSPSIVACDLHPGYYSSRIAVGMTGRTVLPVQHHHAHIISCMAENMLDGEVLGLALDGTGYGQDGRIWGGEFLRCSPVAYTRLGHVAYFPLPGGEKAVREPWRTATSLLNKAFGKSWHEYANKLDIVPGHISCNLVDRILDRALNAPLTSSMGRIFDGVSSILGIRQQVHFEGQSAMELEALAYSRTMPVLPYEIKAGQEIILDFSPMIRALAERRLQGDPPPELSTVFHQTLISALIDVARCMRDETGLNRIVLSGGCFQNRLLLTGCREKLAQAGFDVYTNSLVPVNDGGIALGQALCAAEMMKQGLAAADQTQNLPGGIHDKR